MLYNEFMAKYGTNTTGHLSKPRNTGLESLILPQSTTLNFVNYNIFELGLTRMEPALASFEGKIYSNDITELSFKQGKISHRQNKLDASMRGYYKKNLTIRVARNINRLLDDYRIIIINNYAPLNQVSNFTPTLTREFDMWSSYMGTMLKTIKGSQRQQFMRLELPQLPDLNEFKLLLSRGATKSEVSTKYTDHNLFTLLSVFNAIFKTKSSGSKDNIRFEAFNDLENYENLNFYVVEGTQWAVFNVATLIELAGKNSNSINQMYGMFEHFEDLKTIGNTSQTEDDDTMSPPEDDNIFLKENKAIMGDTKTRAAKSSGVEQIAKDIETLAQAGRLTTASKKRLLTISEKHKKIPAFGTSGGTLSELADLSKVDMDFKAAEVRDLLSVPDKSMLKKTVRQLDAEYVDRVMDSHLAATMLSIQKMGIAVTGLHETTKTNINDDMRTFHLQLTPLEGAPFTSLIEIPKVSKDGTWKSGGTQYRTSKVRGEWPIVKVSPDRVAVTTGTGKTFITRSPKITDNLDTFIHRQLTLISEDKDNDGITGLGYGRCIVTNVKLPRVYTAIAKRFERVTSHGIKFMFKYADLDKNFPTWKKVASQHPNMIPVSERAGVFYAVDMDSRLFKIGTNVELLGTLLDYFTVDTSKLPTEFANVKLAGKDVPVILTLGYLDGLFKTLDRLEVKYEVIQGRINTELPPGQVIRFRSSHLWIGDEGNKHQLVTNGLKTIRRFAKEYDVEDLNQTAIYQAIFENLKLTPRHLAEAFVFNRMLIDPVTEDILIRKGLPTDFDEILVYCADLLKDDKHTRPKSMDALRTKGYERFSGAISREMMSVARTYHRSPKNARTKVQIHPRAVWSTIVMDPAASPVESSNPMHNMKERGMVTFSGFDGRNGQLLNWDMRKFDESEIGIFGEASPDSSKVGTANYLTPAANLTSLYGEAAAYTGDGTESATLMTGVGALLPSIDQDDTKRINFGSIQASARDVGIGYEISPVGTGFDVAMAHHVDKMWAWPAEQDGKVTKLTENVMEVTYKDGTKDTNRVGLVIGVKAGKYKPRKSTTELQLGSVFKKDDILTYNRDFFGPDPFDKTQVCFKLGQIVNVIYVETNDTLEDSSAISKRMTKGQACPTIKVRDFTFESNKAIIGLVKEGQEIAYREPLLSISEDTGEDEDDMMAQLSNLAMDTPKSEEDGVIVGIEVRYNGEKEAMSESVRKIVNAFDKKQTQLSNDLNDGTAKTGYVKDGLRLNGKVLAKDTIHLRILTEKLLYEGVGDKGGLGNQLKTIHGRILDEANRLSNGEPIDMLFGGKSDQARVVRSPVNVGSTIVLLDLGTKEVYRMFKEG